MRNISKTPPIILTGCARSGTSLMAGIVNICGAFGGKMHGPNKYNQKGMFENAHIRDILEKGYLRKIGVDPMGQKPLAVTKNLMIPNDWREKVQSTMLEEGYVDGPWFYKGAKACQIWPIWNYAFPDAKWLIIRRRSADIADSCLQTSFMHKYDTFEGWIGWIQQHEEKWLEMFEAGINMKQVWPERLMHGDYSQAREAIEWLGLKWDRQKVIEHVEPKLWKAAKKLGL